MTTRAGGRRAVLIPVVVVALVLAPVTAVATTPTDGPTPAAAGPPNDGIAATPAAVAEPIAGDPRPPRNWTQAGNDSRNTGHLATVGPRSNLGVMWKLSRIEDFYSPVVVGDTVYVVGQAAYVDPKNERNVYALNRSTGEIRWSFNASKEFFGSPAVSDGIVYVSNETTIWALDASDGSLVWNATVTGKYKTTSPTVANGTVYVGDDEGVHAIDAATGRELWNHTIGGYVGTTPAVGNGTVYVGFKRYVVALDAATGAVLWNRSLPNYARRPAVVDGTVHVSTSGDEVLALNASTGAVVWNVTTLGTPTPPAVADGTVYVGDTEGYAYALDSATGAVLWNRSVPDGVGFSVAPAVANDTVYLHEASNRGYLFGLDRDTGKALFKYYTGHEFAWSPTVVDGVIYHGLPWNGDSSKVVALTGAPVANVSASDTAVEAGETVTFDASGTTSQLWNVTSYEWDFDNDGKFEATGEQVSHVFEHAGGYVVRLRVTNEQGLTDIAGVKLTVSEPGTRPLQGRSAMAQFDAARTGVKPATGLFGEGSLNVRWRHGLGNHRVLGSPVVANNTVVVVRERGTSGKFVAMNATTGFTEWTYETFDQPTSVVVADGRVYFALPEYVFALDLETGAKAFSLDFFEGSKPKLVVQGDTLYVADAKRDYFEKRPVVAYDADTGEKLWETALASEQLTAPTVANGTVYVGSVGGSEEPGSGSKLAGVYALNASDGSVRWNASTRLSVRAPPTVRNGTVYATTAYVGRTSSYGSAYAIDATTGTIEWRHRLGAAAGGAAATSRFLLVHDRAGNLTALYRSNGSVAWNWTRTGIETAPVVVNGSVYVGSTATNAEGNNRFYLLDAATGTRELTLYTDGNASGPPAIVDDRVFVATTDGEVVAFENTATTDPTAAAGPDVTVGVGDPVSLDATNSTDNVGVLRYEWTLPDGSTLAGATPTTSFDSPGTYRVELTVVDAGGHTDSDAVTVTVEDRTAPSATVSGATTVTVGETVTFDASGSTDNVDVVGYEWSFGDGTSATGATASHVFDSAGTYTVTVTVTDGAGNTDTATLTVTVTSPDTPTPTATPTATPAPTPTDRPTPSATPTPTGTPTPSATPTPTDTPTTTPTDTPTTTPDGTEAATGTSTDSGTTVDSPGAATDTSTPGFGGPAALLAVVLAALATLRRRRRAR